MNPITSQTKNGLNEGSEFYKSMESWLQGNDIELYSIHNERTCCC